MPITRNYDSASRNVLSNVKFKDGCPYERTGDPLSDAPYENDVRLEMERGHIMPDEHRAGRYVLTPSGEIALRNMK